LVFCARSSAITRSRFVQRRLDPSFNSLRLRNEDGQSARGANGRMHDRARVLSRWRWSVPPGRRYGSKVMGLSLHAARLPAKPGDRPARGKEEAQSGCQAARGSLDDLQAVRRDIHQSRPAFVAKRNGPDRVLVRHMAACQPQSVVAKVCVVGGFDSASSPCVGTAMPVVQTGRSNIAARNECNPLLSTQVARLYAY
jgi:hypothetical protein